MGLAAGTFEADEEITGIDLQNVYRSAENFYGDPVAYANRLVQEEVGPLRDMISAIIYLECRLYKKGIPLLFRSLETIWRYPNHYWNTIDTIGGLAISIDWVLSLISRIEANIEPIVFEKLVKLSFLFTSRAIYLLPAQVVYFFVLRAKLTEQFSHHFEGFATGEFEIDNLPIADYYKAYNEGNDPDREIILQHLSRLSTKKEVEIDRIEEYNWYDNLAVGSFSAFLVSLGVYKAYEANELYIEAKYIEVLKNALIDAYPDDYEDYIRIKADQDRIAERTKLEERSEFAEKVKGHLQHNPSYYGYYAYCLQEYVKTIRRQTYEETSRGTAILDTSEKLMAYFIAYGAMHYYKLADAYTASKERLSTALSLSIVDYGCGQALATNILVDFMAKQGIRVEIENLTLIEPSTIAPARGMLLLNMLFAKNDHNPSVKIVHKLLGDLANGDLTEDKTELKIHSFSNILDIEAVDLRKLVDYLKFNSKGDNMFICTSPSYGRKRIDEFYNALIDGEECIFDIVQPNDIGPKKIYKYVQGRLGDYNITRYTRIFTLRFK